MKIKMTPIPAKGVLLERLRYENGKLFWTENGLLNSWFAGRECFVKKNKTGYFCGKFGGKDYLAHRIIWKMHFGFDPVFIDHLDGNRLNNRIENLKNVSPAENARNSRRKLPTSGFANIRKNAKSWNVEFAIWPDKVSENFSSLEDALKFRQFCYDYYGFVERYDGELLAA